MIDPSDVKGIVGWAIVALLGLVAWLLREAVATVKSKMSDVDHNISKLAETVNTLSIAVSAASNQAEVFKRDADRLGDAHRKLDDKVDCIDKRVTTLEVGGCAKLSNCAKG